MTDFTDELAAQLRADGVNDDAAQLLAQGAEDVGALLDLTAAGDFDRLTDDVFNLDVTRARCALMAAVFTLSTVLPTAPPR